nr:MAG TPA: hypothetical protein [Caudoviricetes sp.]
MSQKACLNWWASFFMSKFPLQQQFLKISIKKFKKV